MRCIYILSLVLLSYSPSFASIVNECKAETTINEIITQPTHESPGTVVILLNKSIKNCLCAQLINSNLEQMSIDIKWSDKKDIVEVLPQSKIEVMSQCGSSMGSEGKAIAFSVWYIKKIL